MDGRTQPKSEPRAKIDWLKAGQWVTIQCQVEGELAYGSRIWDKVGGYFVPDHFLKTYTDGFLSGSPRCGVPPPQKPPAAARDHAAAGRRPAQHAAPPPAPGTGCTGRPSASGR